MFAFLLRRLIWGALTLWVASFLASRIEDEEARAEWRRFADEEDNAAKTLIKKPIAAYVERVYEYGSFAGLGIGT